MGVRKPTLLAQALSFLDEHVEDIELVAFPAAGQHMVAKLVGARELEVQYLVIELVGTVSEEKMVPILVDEWLQGLIDECPDWLSLADVMDLALWSLVWFFVGMVLARLAHSRQSTVAVILAEVTALVDLECNVVMFFNVFGIECLELVV